MIVYAAVVSGDTHISIPNAGVIEMPGTFFQCGAVRTFIDLDEQTNRRNFQCSQTAVAVIEVRGNRSGIGHTANRADRADQPAAEGTGDQVGRQGFTRIGQVTGGTAKGGRDQRRVLAAVNIVRAVLRDRFHAGRPAKEIVLRGVHRVVQRIGGCGGQYSGQCRRQAQGFPFHFVYSSHFFSFLRFFSQLCPSTPRPATPAPAGRISR